MSKCGVCECINEPRGFVCVLGPSPASLIPARHIKETGDGVSARCLYMVLPASSVLMWGESRPELGAVDHIWPGVVSPAAILPASTACCQGTVAPPPQPLLFVCPSSQQSLRVSFSSLPFTIGREHTSDLIPPPPPSSPLFFLLLFLSFLPKPASSAHPLSPCFPPSFVLSLVVTSCVSPFSPLSFCNRKLVHLGLLRRVHRSHPILNHLYPPGACVHKFINMHWSVHADTFMCKAVKVLILNHALTSVC